MGIHCHSLILIIVLCLLSVSCPEEVTPADEINSMYFAGSHYLEVPNSATLQSLVAENFTIEVWVQGGDTLPISARTILMAGNNEGGNELGIYQGPRDSSLIYVFIDNISLSREPIQIQGLDWRSPKFHYLCLVKVNDFVSFYYNGQLIKRRQLLNLDLDIGASNFLIGADYDAPGLNSNVGNFWVGYIDEVRLWKKGLNSDEVAFHYQHPEKLTRHYSATGLDDLIGLWRFNQARSNWVPDNSDYGNDAFIRGSYQQLWSSSGTHN